MGVHAGKHVFHHRHLAERADVLEGAGEPALRAFPARPIVDGFAVEKDVAVVLMPKTGDQVERRRLAGAVRADQSVHRLRLDMEGYAIDRRETSEAHSQVLEREDGAVHARAPVRRMRQGTRPCGMNRTAMTMMSPLKTSRKSCSGRNTSGSRVKMIAPTTGPKGEPMPPSSA